MLVVKVKPIDVARRRFEQAISIIPDRYEQGVKLAEWQKPAMDAEDLWADAIMEAAREKRRQKGIAKVTDEEWRKDTINKGKPIIATRIRDALDDWEKGWKPFRDALEALELPEKTTDPITNIDQRVKPVVETLVRKKKELLGVG